MKTVISLFCLIMLALPMAKSQDMQEVWKSTMGEISSEGILKVMIACEDSVKQAKPADWASLIASCRQIQTLENPDTRSLPEIKGRVVFFLKSNKILAVEFVENHWFHGSYLIAGRVVPFIMKDKENKFFQAVQKILTPEKKCEKCSGCSKSCN